VKKVAEEILNQLGGNKFVVMTGVKNLIASENGLSFHLPKSKTKANTCKVILTESDDYLVEFFKVNRKTFELERVSTYAHVYCDQLQEIFTYETGLATSL